MSEMLEKARNYETEKQVYVKKTTKPLFHVTAPTGWINDPNGFSVYDGKIHKCPNCGEVLDSFTLKCPSCGYEMRDASNSDAIKGFAQRLEQTESKDKEIALIKSFPVPNTKEDIFFECNYCFKKRY